MCLKCPCVKQLKNTNHETKYDTIPFSFSTQVFLLQKQVRRWGRGSSETSSWTGLVPLTHLGSDSQLTRSADRQQGRSPDTVLPSTTMESNNKDQRFKATPCDFSEFALKSNMCGKLLFWRNMCSEWLRRSHVW